MALQTGNRTGGFTFVELLIVVAIFAIVAMVALPDLGTTLATSRLASSTAEVAAALEYAQLRAISSGRPTRVKADPTGDRLVLEQMAYSTNILHGGTIVPQAEVENAIYQPIPHPYNRGVAYTVELGLATTPIDLAAADFGGGTSIVFRALGTASDSGSIELRTGSNSRQVRVAGATGRVTVQ